MSKKKYTPSTLPENIEFKDWDYVDEDLAEQLTTYTVKEGENILAVAQQFLPEGQTRTEYAKWLLANNRSVAAGKTIKLV